MDELIDIHIEQYRAWRREYEELKGIPTSKRLKPARAVSYFIDFLREKAFPFKGRVLDVGCGKGRNAFPFLKLGFSVYGLDIVEKALSDFRAEAERRGFSERVFLYRKSIAEPLPFPASSFDLALDITVLDNLLIDDLAHGYAAELARTMRKGGYFLIYFFLREDPYYASLLATSPEGAKGILIDPKNGIRTRIRTPEEIASLFAPFFVIEDERRFRFSCSMYGRVYPRRFASFIMRREG